MVAQSGVASDIIKGKFDTITDVNKWIFWEVRSEVSWYRAG